MLSASSPDDEALVLGAKYFGFEFIDRINSNAVVKVGPVADAPSAVIAAAAKAAARARESGVRGTPSPRIGRRSILSAGTTATIKSSHERSRASPPKTRKPETDPGSPVRHRSGSIFGCRLGNTSPRTVAGVREGAAVTPKGTLKSANCRGRRGDQGSPGGPVNTVNFEVKIKKAVVDADNGEGRTRALLPDDDLGKSAELRPFQLRQFRLWA